MRATRYRLLVYRPNFYITLYDNPYLIMEILHRFIRIYQSILGIDLYPFAFTRESSSNPVHKQPIITLHFNVIYTLLSPPFKSTRSLWWRFLYPHKAMHVWIIGTNIRTFSINNIQRKKKEQYELYFLFSLIPYACYAINHRPKTCENIPKKYTT